MGITTTEALDSLRSDDLIGIGMEADAVRRRMHPEGIVTYTVECNLDCSGEVESILSRAAEMLARGASGLRLVRAAELGSGHLTDLIAALRHRFPEAWIAALTIPEIQSLAGTTAPQALLENLHAAGLNTIAQDGVTLSASPSEQDVWLAIHRAAHAAGMRTVAAMRFGAGETAEQQVAFLESLRALQKQTAGFSAFAPESAGSGLHGPTAVESLRTLAVARLVLDNIENLEAGAATASFKVLQTTLSFGANDAGPVLLDAARPADLREEDLRRIIRDAGLHPAERDPGYRMMFVA